MSDTTTPHRYHTFGNTCCLAPRTDPIHLPDPPNWTIVRTLVDVRWIDSSMIHEQTDVVAEPQVIQTVGILVEQTTRKVVIARDHHFGDNSEPWRSQIAIPRSSVVDMKTLTP